MLIGSITNAVQKTVQIVTNYKYKYIEIIEVFYLPTDAQ